MARTESFSDGLAKGLGLGATIVGFFMMVMFSLLPLGIFSKVLNIKEFFGLKLGIATLFSLITLAYYVRYVKSLRLPPIVWGFGAMISLLMSGILMFVTVDIILKLIGLE